MHPETLDALDHPAICAWLARALSDQEPLPKLTPDESPYLGVLRLDKQVSAPTRRSLYAGCLALLSRFCGDGAGEAVYLRNLLSLAVAFGDRQTPEMLGDFVQTSPRFPALPLEVRFAILGALVDAPPPRTQEFWRLVLQQDPERYAMMALSGALGTFPLRAVQLLPAMPDFERKGQAAAAKLDLTWAALFGEQRFRLVCAVQDTLPRCGPHFAAPLYAWAQAKGAPVAEPRKADSLLARAFQGRTNFDPAPRTLTSKLCPC